MATHIVYDAVRALLLAQFTDAPLVFENENAEPQLPDGPYVMVEMTGDVFTQMSIGAGTRMANRWEERGLIFLHVNAPAGTGGREARRLAALLADVFRGVETLAPGITFEDVSIGLGETSERDGPWWILPLTVQFERTA
jgi:hypothetical protein